MRYIQVENNKIIGEPRNLPTSWGNISNFHVMDQNILKEYGWFPYEQEDLVLNENEIVIGSEYVIESNRVLRRPVKRQLTQEEIDQRRELETEKKWEEIRNRRNQLLLESDWTQLPDVDVANRESWKSYRQSLRDITNPSDPDLVSWPSKPSIIQINPYVPPTPNETPTGTESNTGETDSNLGG